MNNKEIRPQIVRHGEVILKPVSGIPQGATLDREEARMVVAHSETGHHHVLELKEKADLSKIRAYAWNGSTYLEVPEIAELWHQKSGRDAHRTHRITPGTYELKKKREYDYFAGKLREVRD